MLNTTELFMIREKETTTIAFPGRIFESTGEATQYIINEGFDPDDYRIISVAEILAG